ncbi:hypothetical protein VSH64_16150 [Amycolatopsis rhabdoformis]|uniref:MBL fold metallo-hydrolase n=1 Tax=Amycolatopsis rhabdoformis TaxID=1448059 RepID=A0ABZ1IGN2_9PSEU|nr:hypothetical protein [Amycolatopsis rhabdoformis]WSE33620.1 hypothetical protein VSH64_16150 [Amycolatopsis rhabdoformis]
MKIHHLNCGTLRPWATPGGLVCRVLLVETPAGLVLVDADHTGGLADFPFARVHLTTPRSAPPSTRAVPSNADATSRPSETTARS